MIDIRLFFNIKIDYRFYWLMTLLLKTLFVSFTITEILAFLEKNYYRKLYQRGMDLSIKLR